MRTLHKTMWVAALALVAVTAVSLSAQAPTKTASQFYMDYRAAFDKAQKIEELFPFMSADSRKRVEATPAAERTQMFGMMKIMGTLTDVKILREERKGAGATLTVEGIDSDKAKMKGTIDIVREGGAWKVGQENWSN